MKMWFFGKSDSLGDARSRKSGIGGRLDRFVTEIAQAVEDKTPLNFAVDANYELIQNSVTRGTPPRGISDRARGVGTLSASRNRNQRDRG